MRSPTMFLRTSRRGLHTQVSRSKSVAFIGLGQMGYQMAQNLVQKLPRDTNLLVCDARQESAQAFKKSVLEQNPNSNVDVVQSPEEAVNAAQTIVTMLPSSPQVKSVYSEAGGIIPSLRAMGKDRMQGTLCIDSTTLNVEVAREVATQVNSLGAQMVDAPVSGGVKGAQAGTLSFLVGGSLESFTSASAYLRLMGQKIVHCGPSGAGLSAKICNNLILGIQQVAVAEAMLLGQSLGLDPSILAEVIQGSTGASWSMGVNNPVPKALLDKSPPCEHDYDGGFATALMLKDMGLATDLNSNINGSLPLGEAAEGIYSHVISEHPDFARKDFSVVYKYLVEVQQQNKKLKFGKVECS